MIRLLGDGLPKATIGQFVPYLFGRLRQTPCLPTCTGQVDAIPEAMTATSPPTGGTLLLSDPESVRKMGDSGTVQIDGERIAYSGRDLVTPALLNIVRGTGTAGSDPSIPQYLYPYGPGLPVLNPAYHAPGGGTATSHSVGATVYEILQQLVFVVGENPSGFLTQAVSQVYLNGVKKAATATPTHTVNLNDTTLIPGRSVVTITFDMSQFVPSVNPSPIFNGNLAIMGGSDAPPSWGTRLRTWWRQWRWRRRRPRHAISGGSPFTIVNGATASTPGAVITGSLPGYGYTYAVPGQQILYNGPNLRIMSPIGAVGSSVTAPFTTGAPATRPPALLSYPAPILGTVTADVIGLQDDATGTITGTPSTLLTHPAWITRAILHLAFGETSTSRYDLSGSWATTHAQQVADGFTWACRFVPMSLETLRDLAGTQGWADLYLQDGVWHYQWADRTDPVYTLNVRSALGDPVFGTTAATDLTTVLSTTYNVQPYDTTITTASTAGVARYGERRGRTLNLPWVTDATMAQTLASRWLGRWGRPRLTLQANLPWEALPLQKTDVITAQVPVMTEFGPLRVGFTVREFGQDLDRAIWELVGIEADPSGLRLRSGYRMLVPQTGYALPSGYLVAVGTVGADTLALGLTESGLVVALTPATGADSLSLGLTEGGLLTGFATLADGIALALTDAGALLFIDATASADTVAMALTEAASTAVVGLALDTADTVALACTDAASTTVVGIAVSAADSLAVTLTEASAAIAYSSFLDEIGEFVFTTVDARGRLAVGTVWLEDGRRITTNVG